MMTSEKVFAKSFTCDDQRKSVCEIMLSISDYVYHHSLHKEWSISIDHTTGYLLNKSASEGMVLDDIVFVRDWLNFNTAFHTLSV